jgi:hypothetical protein
LGAEPRRLDVPQCKNTTRARARKILADEMRRAFTKLSTLKGRARVDVGVMKR